MDVYWPETNEILKSLNYYFDLDHIFRLMELSRFELFSKNECPLTQNLTFCLN
jgi:hypothetical protein